MPLIEAGRDAEKEKNYRIEYKASNALVATEYFTQSNGMIDRVVLYYNEMSYDPGFRQKKETYKPRIEVALSGYKTGMKISNGEFDEKNYVALVNGKYKGTGIYSSYKVFDTRPPLK